MPYICNLFHHFTLQLGKMYFTFLSLHCLVLSSFPTLRPGNTATLTAVGFLAISTSCCNDSGDPGLAASCRLKVNQKVSWCLIAHVFHEIFSVLLLDTTSRCLLLEFSMESFLL